MSSIRRFLFSFYVVAVLLIISGCKNSKPLEGNWETVCLIKDEVAQQIVISNIKFTNKEKTLKASGCAGVNLFIADAAVNGKNINFSNMSNTGFMGLMEEMEYEDLFFQGLMNTKTYAIKDNVLYLYAPSEGLEIQLQRK